jgi:hypothetical protein
MPMAASAAERAAAKFSATTMNARELQHRVLQAGPEGRHRPRFRAPAAAALLGRAGKVRRDPPGRRHGVSAEGQAIAASVAALQAQRAAAKGAAEGHTLIGATAKVATSAYGGLVERLKGLVIAYVSVEAARKLWEIGAQGRRSRRAGRADRRQYRSAAGLSSGRRAGRHRSRADGYGDHQAREVSMGSAADGNKEMIELFQELKVNLLDAKGRAPPDRRCAARGGARHSRRRLVVAADRHRDDALFGKSGAKMATVLKDIAKGNDALIESRAEPRTRSFRPRRSSRGTSSATA